MCRVLCFAHSLLELTDDKHHVHCASVGSEAAMTLLDMLFGYGWYKPVERNSGKDFTGNIQKGDCLVVGTVKVVSLVLVQSEDVCIVEVLR